MKLKLILTTAIVGAALALPGSAARAATPATPGELMALSQSAVYDPATGQVTFTLTFNRAPDFQSVDELDRPADSFQYFIVGDPSLSYPNNYDTIIRGEELHISSPVLRVRNATPTDPTDPPSVSGGWGTVRGVVPYQLNGNVLTFSTPLALISDHSADGHFTYDLIITQYGGQTQFLPGLESVVRPRLPLPRLSARTAAGATSRVQEPGAVHCVRHPGPVDESRSVGVGQASRLIPSAGASSQRAVFLADGAKSQPPLTAVGRASEGTGSRACIVFGSKGSLRRPGRTGKNRGGQRERRNAQEDRSGAAGGSLRALGPGGRLREPGLRSRQQQQGTERCWREVPPAGADGRRARLQVRD